MAKQDKTIEMVNSQSIGNKIAMTRKKMNLSQADLARQISISPQAVGKWERGESMPDITTLNRLAEILGVDLNYFSENFKTSTAETISNKTYENQYSPITSENPKENPGRNMSNLNLVDSDFSGLKNLHERFSSSNMQNCQFIDSEMSGLLLKNNNVDKCDFSKSDLSHSSIQNSNLANSQFKNCSLRDTVFTRSFITNCDFTGADFTGVNFKSGGLEKINAANTVWNRTAWMDTHLVNTVFEGTLRDCIFENCTFTKVKFQNVVLLNTFFKNNRKMKKVEFIDCKTDKITYAFLKNNLADLTGITLAV